MLTSGEVDRILQEVYLTGVQRYLNQPSILGQFLDGRVSWDIETVQGIHDSWVVTVRDPALKVADGL